VRGHSDLQREYNVSQGIDNEELIVDNEETSLNFTNSLLYAVPRLFLQKNAAFIEAGGI
jgi:hypothetical protein